MTKRFKKNAVFYTRLGGTVRKVICDASFKISDLIPCHLESGGVRLIEESRMYDTEAEVPED